MKARFLLLLTLALTIGGCQSQYDLPPTERGKVLFREGKFDEAIAACTEAIAQDPENAEAFTFRGRAYLSKGDAHRAIDEYNEAIRISPTDPEPYYNRAVAYKTLGDDKRWGEDEKRARELDPLYAQAYLFTPRDENELEARVLAATLETESTEPAEEELPLDIASTKSASSEPPAAPKSSAAEALSRLSSRAESSARDTATAKKSARDSSPSVADPFGQLPGLSTSTPATDPFALPSLGANQPTPQPTVDDEYGLGRSSLATDSPQLPSRRAQGRRGTQPALDAPRQETSLSRRQIQQDINAGEINARRLANRAWSMQSEGSSGYSASPFSGLTDSPFPQPRRSTTGVQDAYGGYGGSGINAGARAGQGPLNPYGATRSAPAYTPTVPQPNNVPDLRNFAPSGPVSDFYYSP